MNAMDSQVDVRVQAQEIVSRVGENAGGAYWRDCLECARAIKHTHDADREDFLQGLS